MQYIQYHMIWQLESRLATEKAPRCNKTHPTPSGGYA